MFGDPGIDLARQSFGGWSGTPDAIAAAAAAGAVVAILDTADRPRRRPRMRGAEDRSGPSRLPRLVLCVIAASLTLSGCTAAASRALPPTPLGLDAVVNAPAGNPLTAPKVALGERLFFDPTLSRDRSVACASCHRPEHAFSDTARTSVGVAGRRGRRNAPTLLNRAYARALFWDGRVATLEEQVLHPIQDSLEMALPLGELVARLRHVPSYRRAFGRAFGGEVTAHGVARALASYVRTLRAGDAPVDRWRAGDSTALPAAARRGLALFVGRANCAACHAGPNFTDERFHDTGVAWSGDAPSDSGHYVVTREPRDLGAFKTPTLRDVACSAPYMHDGSLATLDDVIDFYDRGGRANAYLDVELRPLHLLAAAKQDLAAFLRALGTDCGAARDVANAYRTSTPTAAVRTPSERQRPDAGAVHVRRARRML